MYELGLGQLSHKGKQKNNGDYQIKGKNMERRCQ